MARRNKSVIWVRRLGWPVAAGRRRAGDGGEGVTAAAVALGGGVRSGLWAAATSMAAAVLGSRGGGSRGRRRHQAQIDEKPSVRGRAKEEVIWGAFCPGWSHHPGQNPLLSRVVDSPGTKGVFWRAGKIPSPRPTFSPGWIYHPGQKGPVFPRSRLILCLFLFLFTSLLKLAFIC